MNIVLFILILIFFTLMGFLYYRLCQRTAIEVLNRLKKSRAKGGEEINARSSKNYVKSAK